jgi:hypothetical protein
MNQVLSDESARRVSMGRGNPLEIGRPAAAKLGQLLDGSAAWTVGYTPQRLALVWMGVEQVEPAGLSPLPAAGLWHALMAYAVQDLPAEEWTQPADIRQLEVCDPSGMLPGPACPSLVSEIFLEGSQPVQVDDLFQVCQVNRETGLLATIFTPPGLVDGRTCMNVPPQAQAWAEAAGIPLPPAEYDTILQPSPHPDVNINTPALFTDVRGEVEIRGSAAGLNFAWYRIEYGQGLDPQGWVQIGADVSSPVEEGVLANWDTSGLDGLVALRLMLVHTDQSVETALTQVVVDNTPPQVSILSPQPGQEFSLSQSAGVVLQAQVIDPYLIYARLYVDDDLVGEYRNAPFSMVWQATEGRHVLRVLAIDRAGNQTITRQIFLVHK